MIKGYAKSFNLAKALEVFEEMKSTPGMYPNNVTFNSLIDCCVRTKKCEKALHLLEEMKSRGIRPDLITFSTLIKGFCKD